MGWKAWRGRCKHQIKVIFMLALYNTSNHNDQLKLGANNLEQAAKWIQSFHKASLKGYEIEESSIMTLLEKRG